MYTVVAAGLTFMDRAGIVWSKLLGIYYILVYFGACRYSAYSNYSRIAKVLPVCVNDGDVCRSYRWVMLCDIV